MNFALAILMSLCTTKLAAQSIVWTGELPETSLASNWLLEDSKRQLTILDFQSEPVPMFFEKNGEMVKLDRNQVFWKRFVIHNQLDQPQTIYLQNKSGNHVIEKAFLIVDGEVQDLARQAYRYSSFPVDLPAASTVQVYVRYYGSAYHWVLQDRQQFLYDVYFWSLFIGLVFGGLLLLSKYALLMFSFFREAYFLYYLLYLGTLFSLIVSNNFSIIYESWILQIYTWIGPIIFGSLFINSFLNLRSLSPTLYLIHGIIFITAILYATVLNIWFLPDLLAILWSGVILVGITGGSLSYFRGDRPALLFTLGWIALILSLVGIVLIFIFGRDDGSNSSLGGIIAQVGVLLEMILFSLSMNLRLRQSEQKALRERVHGYHQLEKLVYPHQVGLTKQGQQIEQTMPTGQANACVLVFDIQQSSRLGHIRHLDFLVTVLKRCHAKMIADYDPDRLSANAYMVKEMGDGFICSVGFPFHCDGSIHDRAVELAFDFVNIFRDEVAKKLPKNNQDVYCSIGISYGDVIGQFPKIGLKQYDLYGEAIVKASRYEAFRKIFFEETGLARHDIILLQKLVYENLSEANRLHFQSYELSGKKMRDDASADCLYYRLGPAKERQESVA